jgi:hypothetical protein
MEMFCFYVDLLLIIVLAFSFEALIFSSFMTQYFLVIGGIHIKYNLVKIFKNISRFSEQHTLLLKNDLIRTESFSKFITVESFRYYQYY